MIHVLGGSLRPSPLLLIESIRYASPLALVFTRSPLSQISKPTPSCLNDVSNVETTLMSPLQHSARRPILASFPAPALDLR